MVYDAVLILKNVANHWEARIILENKRLVQKNKPLSIVSGESSELVLFVYGIIVKLKRAGPI